MSPNKEQKLAIENIDNNLVVNAGAGTGKTMVLVNRYIEILKRGNLKNGEEVESIVAITFTKKAAEEMIERIRKSIREQIDSSEKWSRIYREMDKAKISTIHSFCGDIIRENTIELGLDPTFEILDEMTSNKMLEESINIVLSKKIDEDNEFLNMLIDLDIRYLSELVNDLKSTYTNIRNSTKSLEEVLVENIKLIETFNIDEGILKEIEDSFLLLMENARKNAKVNKLTEDENWERFVNREITSNEELINILNYLLDFTGSSKKLEDVIVKIEELVIDATKIMESYNIRYYELIIDILKDIDDLYTEKKRDLAGLDYDDLQILVYQLLQNLEIRKFYQNKFKYIMVDEFQDTNKLQRDIFYMLASRDKLLDRNNFFIVGDPKQSIYGFRGGDLDVYYETIEDIKKTGGQLITLKENYRTSGPIMDFVNTLFSNIMLEKYDPLNSNKPALQVDQVELLENPDLEVPPGENKSQYHKLYEADLIAKRILNLVKSGYDYGDIAILFRSANRNKIYEEALRNYNIPHYNYSGDGFYKKQEILDLINSLKAILNPKDIISNIGFLRSPMIGLSDLEIYSILKHKGSIKDRLESYNEKETICSEKIKEILKLYERSYLIGNEKSYSDLLGFIIRETNYANFLLSQENGKQMYLNLVKFSKIIEDYDQEFKVDQIDLIRYLEDLSLREEEEFPLIESDMNRVQIMTIHKSKGLEFPIVILPELSNRPVTTGFKIAYTKDIGLAIDIENKNALAKLLKEHIKTKEEKEEERILYVGTTRAEEMLILGMQGNNSGYKKLLVENIEDLDLKNISTLTASKEDPDNDFGIYKESPDLTDDIYIIEDKEYDLNPMEFFSISKYMDFKDCKRKFYYNNILKLKDNLDDENQFKSDNYYFEDTSMNAILKGDIVHKFAELYREGYDKDSLLRNVVESFGENYEELKIELDSYIDNFIDFYKEDRKMLREEFFSLSIGEGIYTGIIDRIDIYDDFVDIVDYKTNRIKDKDSLNLMYQIYEDQILFYVYVVEKMFSKQVRKSGLLLLEIGEYLNIDYSKDKIDELIMRLVEFTKYVRSTEDIKDYHKTKNCKEYCDYYKICNRENL